MELFVRLCVHFVFCVFQSQSTAMAEESTEWTTITSARKKNPWLSQSKCQELERNLNIRKLAQCLSSQASRDLQSKGYRFWKVVEEDHLEAAKKSQPDIVTIPVENKWKDHACFILPLSES